MIYDSSVCRKACLVNWRRSGSLSYRMIVSLRNSLRSITALAVLFLLTAAFCPAARSSDKDKDKKPEKEKKEKIEPWVEIRTSHFIVASDGGEKTARRFADQFESLVRVFQATMPNSRVSTGIPVRILVSRDGQSFARMAPEFPYDKRHEREQPPGLIFFGPEKTYIGIRGNAPGHFPYTEIFQNYAREILKQSYRNLPPWLEEGYSTVYGSITFGDRGVRLERPEPDDLSVLFQSPLLPLDLVLHVDRSSGYYNPGNKRSVYFAESRVLVHFLISDPQFASTKSMERYVTAVQGGADSLQAARDAFGDLNQLQEKLDAYVKNVSGPPADIAVPGASDSGGSPRTLSVPEIDARVADFMALRGKVEDAQDKLEEALMSQPSLPEAEQSLGFLMLKQDNADEAQKHFDRAAQLDPNDALNFYGQGLVAASKADKGSAPAGAAAAFEKAVALNRDFAPAWYNLAMVYSERPETLQKALAAAQRAAALAPGNSGYQLQVAALQDRVSHPEEARGAAARAQESASARATPEKSGGVAVRMPPPPPSAASASAAAPPVKTPSDSAPRIERKTESDAKPAASSTASTASTTPKPAPAPVPAPVPPLVTASTQIYSMVGTITDVNCANAPQIQVTLKSQTIAMKLHSDNLENVSIKAANSAVAPKGTTCASLRGRSARVSYHLVSGKAWDGEIQAVEFRSQP
jgi:tetratricopeptide (TPR) repeat protein